MEKAITPWLQDSNLEATDWQVDGEPAGKRFTTQIKGQRAYAARRADQAIGILKLPGRSAGWRKITAPSALGGTEVEISLGPDKNPKTVSRELGCKKIAKTLTEIYGNKRFFADREKGVVSSPLERHHLLRTFSRHGEADHPLQRQNVMALDVDAATVRNAVQNLFASSGDAEWRV